MDNKEFDKFELSDKPVRAKSKNFFLDNSELNTIAFENEQIRHLNDYDSNILQEGAYKEVSDDIFKIEYKISKTEDDIHNLKSQLITAHAIGDTAKIAALQSRLSVLNENYDSLLNLYNEKALLGKISGSITGIYNKTVGTKISTYKEKLGFIFDKILSKLPEKFSSVLKIKRSLYALQNINKSVDALVSMDIPYGESTDKYSKLSKYIIKANSLQSEISKYIKP